MHSKQLFALLFTTIVSVSLLLLSGFPTVGAVAQQITPQVIRAGSSTPDILPLDENDYRQQEEEEEEIVIDNHDFSTIIDMMADQDETTPQRLLLGEGKQQQLSQMQQKLCPSENVKGTVCTIKDKQIRFTHDVFYTTDKSIILDASKVKCLNTNYTPCTIHLHLAGDQGSFLQLQNGSEIKGKQVLVQAEYAEVRITENSNLWASGQSVSVNGTRSDGVGASFIGQGGGVCNPDEKFGRSMHGTTYGEFDMLPHKDSLEKVGSQMGSCGQSDDVETAGGGRIVLLADSVVLQGAGEKLSANGRPYQDFKTKNYSLQGGSGGYVYVGTRNKFANNTIDDEAEVSAKGGFSVGEHASGSGGVVVFDDNFYINSHQVHVNGGVAEQDPYGDGCKNGASGTIWYRKNDTLVVNNNESNSTAYTVVRVPSAKAPLEDDRYELSKKLYVADGARLFVDDADHKDMTLDELYVFNYSWLQLSQSIDRLHLHTVNETYISGTSTLDFTKTKFSGIYTGKNNTDATFGKILYHEFLGIRGTNINLIGEVNLGPTIKDSYKPQSKVVVEAANITIFSESEVSAGYTLLEAKQTVEMMEGSKVTSLRENSCNLDRFSTDLFLCFDKTTLDYNLTEALVSQNFKNQFHTKDKIPTFRSVMTGLTKNFTTYIVAYESVKLNSAQITGPRIGVCTTNLTLIDSSIETSGHGCLGDEGLGRGHQIGECAGSGAAHAGRGGYGGIEHDQNDIHVTKCKKSFPSRTPYAHGRGSQFEGSGGASGTATTYTGGSGGGIVRLNVLDTLTLQKSEVLANGEPGVRHFTAPGSGGGAGGSIEILTRNIQGVAKIEARGGDGSEGGGGGGSGGLLIINFLRGFSAAQQPAQSHFWEGTHTLTGGVNGLIERDSGFVYVDGLSGQDGEVLAGKCFGGYSGPFCKACPSGTFKYDFSYATCQPCDNKPLNAFYSDIAAATSNCPYECSEGLDPIEVNRRCQNALELQVERVGGVASALLVSALFLSLVFVMWIALIIQSKLKGNGLSSFNSKVYDGVLFNSDVDLSPEEKFVAPRSLAMKDEDIWSHTHRMYLLGDNSIKFPWFLPSDFPNRALNQDDQQKFLAMIKEKQSEIEWTGGQKDVYFIFRILCPPLADMIHRCFRKRHFNVLQDEVYKTFNSDFWEMNGAVGKTLRVSASTTDYQLTYIDFLDYERSKSDYIGPQLPITLLLAGRGTFNSPFYLNFEDDSLAKSVVYFHKATLKDQLPLFFENLNTLLGRLSFYKFTGYAKRDLAEVIDWIELGNKTLFNPLDTNATLYLFENLYEETGDETSFEQKRRSFPMESIVFESFPDVYESLIQYIQTKLLSGESEIRLGLVFKPYDAEKRQQLMDRIRKIMAKNKSQLHETTNSFTDRTAQNLIFGDSHEEDENERLLNMSAGGAGKNDASLNQLKTAKRSNSEGSSLLQNESSMEESSVFIHGANTLKKVKIVDKSKRAFEISNQSTQEIELALQKPRDSWNHKFLKLKGVIFAFWLLLFKHHSLPPKKGSRYPYFFGFAISVSFDLLLSIVLCFHCVRPLSNMQTLGVPFLLLLPAMTLGGPLLGIFSALTGSPELLKLQSSFNCTAVLVNYPLTLLSMLVIKDDPFYVAMLILLWVNKVTISYTGTKVRQHWLNPSFSKNYDRIQERFRSLIYAKNDTAKVEGGEGMMTAQQRASSLSSSGLPTLTRNSKKINSPDSDDDELLEIEDETSFGIIPKGRLGDLRSSMSEF